jgi:hypothetical protein
VIDAPAFASSTFAAPAAAMGAAVDADECVVAGRQRLLEDDVGGDELRDLPRRDVAVPGRAQLVPGRQVQQGPRRCELAPGSKGQWWCSCRQRDTPARPQLAAPLNAPLRAAELPLRFAFMAA